MFVSNVELHEACTMDEAFALMDRLEDARILAGGTDLLVDLKVGRASACSLISIKRIDALKGIAERDGDWRIGALTTITELGASECVKTHLPVLIDATSKMAAPQIRNVATVGGNIVSAVPCADLPPVFLVLNAGVTVQSSEGERCIPLDSFFQHVRKTALRSDEMLTAIVVPKPPDRFGAAYARFSLRDGNSIAVAGVAAGLEFNERGEIVSARVSLGAVSPTPMLVADAEDILVGNPLDDDACVRVGDAAMGACSPICDVRGSDAFRREIVGILAGRALRLAQQRAMETPS